jgi:hypothetical protein
MACCGQGRSVTPNAAAHTAPADASSRRGPVLFEHRGAGALTLYGRVTGIRYHFTGPGARVPVDARDAAIFDLVRELERVSV